MTAAPFGPAYVLKTPRLLLRCFAPEDAALRKDAVDSSGEHLADSFPPTPNGPMPLEAHAVDVRRIRSQFDGDGHRGYAAFSADGKVFLGEGGLLRRAGIGAFEISYWLRRDATGQGLATEMACALLKSAFELDGVARVDLLCAVTNARSAAVAKRLGFKLEGRLRDRQIAAHHTRKDLLSFSMLAEEYPDSIASRTQVEAWDFLGRKMPFLVEQD